MRHVCGASILACIVAMAQPVVGWSQHQHSDQSSPAGVGAPASGFDLKLLDGKAVSLETFRGKPLVMNFFASWCDPCRDEMPLINDLAAKAMKGNYQLVGIAVEDTRAAVLQFAREAKLAFPIAIDVDSKVKRSYRIFGPPATFFIDAEGVIRDVVLGPVNEDRARNGLRKIGALL